MLERLAGLEEEYQHVADRMNDPAVLSDQRALRETGRRLKELEPIVAAFREYRAALDDLGAAKELGMKDEAAESEATIARLEDELRVLLLPRDPNDDK
ncbi:MAG TPA: PCRF domain-containing protein, partial [Acidimicrobiales bacterium]|nr:PCRF domain-containing protein [Acidimicrobiales bacterium]